MRVASHIFFLFLLFSGSLSAQVFETEWIRTYGGSDDDRSIAAIINHKGNLVVAGTTYSSDFDTTVQIGDYWVFELDSNGDILWSATYGGSAPDECYTIIQTLDSNYVIGGISYSIDGDITTPLGNADAFVLKIDTVGNIIWAKNYGGSDYERAYSMIESSSGYIYLASSSVSNDGMVSGHHGTTSTSDVWIAKIDQEGNLLDEQSFGSNLDDSPYDIKIDSFHDLLLTSRAGGNSGDVSGHHGWNDIWLLKVDTTLVLVSQQCYGGSESDSGYDYEQVGTNGIVAGHTYSNDGDVEDFIGGTSDAWPLKVDSSLNLIQKKCIGGTEGDGLYAIEILNNNQFLFSGVSASTDGDFTDNYGDGDIWFLATDSNFNILYKMHFGGSDDDNGYTLNIDAENSIYLSSYTSSSDYDFPDNHGIYDVFVIKLNMCTTMFYADLDGDGFGNAAIDSMACNPPPGFVADSTDCDDTNDLISPAATDVCNAFDDNCNGLIDEDALFITYYFDADGDNFGDVLSDSTSCAEIIGYVDNSADCNDSNPSVFPDAPELCNSIDDNCNTFIDEGLLIYTLYADTDGDTYGDPLSSLDTCTEIITGFVSNNLDCNDIDPTIYAGAEEICNSLDDDCDGIADDNLIFVWQYQDTDGDLFGNTAMDTLACFSIPGYVPDSSDCDDSNPNIYPGAPEILNGIDDDCDGQSDEGLAITNATTTALNIYPIPATEFISIDAPIISTATVNIYNSSGEIVLKIDNWTGEAINISRLPAAVYFVQILQKGSLSSGYFIKE